MIAEDKLLEGYWYSTKDPVGGKRKVSLNTGKPGILQIITAIKKSGLPDEIVQKEITVFIQGQWIPLEALNHKSNEDTKQE